MQSLDGTTRSWGRVMLLATGIGYAALMITQAIVLPDSVPAHVGPGGSVTRWHSRTAHVALASLTGAGAFTLMWLIPKLVTVLPRELLNLPHKDHWTTPQNFPTAVRMITDEMGWFGAATMALLTVVMWQVGGYTEQQETVTGLWVAIATYSIAALGWALWQHFGPRWRPEN